MKLTKAIISFVFAIVNIFLFPYIALCVYEWFSPHVGFDLPELTYWNMFALILLKGVIFYSRAHVYNYATFNILATTEEEKDTVKEWIFTISYLAIWGMAWIYQALIF